MVIINNPSNSTYTTHITQPTQECSICLSSEYLSIPENHDQYYDLSQTQYITTCGHVYHNECIMRWTTTNNNCPICRTTIFSSNHNHNHNHIDNTDNNHIDIDIDNNDLSNNYYTPPPTPRRTTNNTPPRFDRTNYHITRNSFNVNNYSFYNNQLRRSSSIDYNNRDNNNDTTTLFYLTDTLEEFINIYPNIHRTNNITHITNLIRQEINYYQNYHDNIFN